MGNFWDGESVIDKARLHLLFGEIASDRGLTLPSFITQVALTMPFGRKASHSCHLILLRNNLIEIVPDQNTTRRCPAGSQR